MRTRFFCAQVIFVKLEFVVTMATSPLLCWIVKDLAVNIQNSIITVKSKELRNILPRLRHVHAFWSLDGLQVITSLKCQHMNLSGLMRTIFCLNLLHLI